MDSRGTRRPAEGPPVDWSWLTRSATREQVIDGLATFLPRDLCDRLDNKWREDGELVDGKTLRRALELPLAECKSELRTLGMAQTVAQRVLDCWQEGQQQQPQQQSQQTVQQVQQVQQAQQAHLPPPPPPPLPSQQQQPVSQQRRQQSSGSAGSRGHGQQLEAVPPAAAEAGHGAEQQVKQEEEQQEAPAAHDEEPDAPAVQDEEPAAIVVDLGPPAGRGQWQKDWTTRARWGLPAIFKRMSIEELRAMLESELTPQEYDAAHCLQVVGAGNNGWRDLEDTPADLALAAERTANFLLTGDARGKPDDEDEGLPKAHLKAMLRGPFCDAAVQAYVQQDLVPRYQNVPVIADPHKLMWNLWRYPIGPFDGLMAGGVQLGTRTMQIDQLCDLPTTNYGGIRLRAVRQALALGDLRLADQERHVQWLDELEQLTKRQSVQVYLRLFPDVPGARQLRAYVLHNIKDATNRLYIVRTTSLINGVWKRSAQGAQGLTVVDVHALLRGLDGAAGSPAMQQMNRMANEVGQLQAALEQAGLPSQQDHPLDSLEFAALLERVAALAGPGEQLAPRELAAAPALQALGPLPRQALARLLREERARGGAARHLWVKHPLPGHPEGGCFVSPALRQVRFCTSKIETEQWTLGSGGAGWVALQESKAELVAGAVVLHPPPANWRLNRAYQSPRASDHLAATLNNCPHGGTLVVVPPSAIGHWHEAMQAAAPGARILRWQPDQPGWTLDCRQLAGYDAVLVASPDADALQTLCHVRWWRVVVDWPSVRAGRGGVRAFLEDSKHPWFASHRWVLCGTAPKDIMEAVYATVDDVHSSQAFMKLSGCKDLLRHCPPALAYLLKKCLVRSPQG